MRRETAISAASISVAFLIAAAVTVLSVRMEQNDSILLFSIPFAASIVLIPAGILRKMRLSQIDSARKNLPEFLRDLSDYTMYGVPLSDAVIRVSVNDYGSLNPEIKDLARRVKGGEPVEEAMENFGQSIGIMDLQRIGVILRKAGESGSNTADVISLISNFTSQLQLLREERVAEMRNYNLILMVSFAVFFIVILIIDLQFFHAIKLNTTGSFAFHSTGATVLERIFDIGIYVEAIGIGAIIGMVKNRNPSSGFLEMGSMLLVSSLVMVIAGVI
ncbi:MAG: type II secretion system F family protein [Candidatus Thermoplasmatota archaeon]|nr:type II secretion system F family protein [Candidatus Thermoplasmatota archaeon]